MGLVLSACHPDEQFGEEEGGAIARLLREAFGDGVPLGQPGAAFFSDEPLGGEMAWSWWSELQRFAAGALGEARVPQLLAVDAWFGVYVDVRTEPTKLRGGGGEDEARPEPHRPVEGERQSVWARVLGLVGVRSERERVMDAGAAAMRQMVRELGPRDGDMGSVQAGDLRALKDELDALASHLGVEASEEAVVRLGLSYAEDDARVEEDGHVQCFCHAWVTAHRALEMGCPMWVVK
ncbi:MAG TPA: hypothetical protein VFF69_14570 [Phycisphaerales bacterium]|nr:hypothetical protein [Phycisphaerales bacterium]